MKKLICLATIGFILSMTVGCANGPIRNWLQGSSLQGAPCNSCQPPLQPSFGSQSVAPCTDGCQTSSAIPNQIIQPTGSGIAGPIAPLETSYYSANDPTTQTYQTQPYGGQNPPVYGNIPTSLEQAGQGFGGSGARGGGLAPPSLNFSLDGLGQ